LTGLWNLSIIIAGSVPLRRLCLSLACKKEENETMNPKIVIRNETPDDVFAITEVTLAAFKTLEISSHTEQFIIEALRAAKALTVSLVAEVDGRVIGHIAFSPVTLLSPVGSKGTTPGRNRSLLVIQNPPPGVSV
jgi:hypothetical protein